MKCKNCSREVNLSRSKNLCDVCLDYQKSRYHAKRDKILEKQYKKIAEKKKISASLGMCLVCFKNPVTPPSKSYCSVCLEKLRIKNRRNYNNRNVKAIHRANERSKNRRAKNQDEYREYGRNYYKLHPEKYIAAPITRRARKKLAEGRFTEGEWQEVLDKYDRKCLWCGSVENICRDHIVPLSRGGSNYISNIQPLCTYCNEKKMTKIIDFRPFGAAILDWT